jgi:hypothetical protein
MLTSGTKVVRGPSERRQIRFRPKAMNETKTGVEKKPGCSVVVLFEDGKARQQAMTFCDHLVERFWSRQEFRVDWWDFAALRNPAHTHDILDKALEADVIVFATNPAGNLPEAFHDWIESWIPLRAEREGAVVGLMDPGSRVTEYCPPKFAYLRNAAHRAGMDYWTSIPQNLARSVPDSLESYSERAQKVTSVLDEILHYHPSPSL